MIRITSKQNDWIKRIKSLHKKNGRKKEGLYIMEGIKTAEEAKGQLEALLMSDSFLTQHPEWEKKSTLYCEKVFVTTDEIFKEVSDTMTPQGVLAVLPIPKVCIEDLFINEKPFLILGDEIQDPGNIGTIIRTADASGAHGVVLNKGSVDIYSPKAIRSMMGSQLHIPILYVEDLSSFIDEIKEKGISVYGAHLEGKSYHYQMDYRQGTAIVIGNEANGISVEVADKVDYKVLIPMLGQAESLNAGVAAGILMYEVVRQRML